MTTLTPSLRVRQRDRRGTFLRMSSSITLHHVKSEAIQAWGYDQASRTMVVQFRRGGTFSYKGVPVSTALDVLADEHPGRVFARDVRDIYPHQRLL